ncbi:Unknown protein [Striga hermonthica]|uniref:Protein TRIGALACTOSYLDIACYLGLYCEROL 4, chloroplastic n=1 Tax=Striga hermonthica TaxID=68872 RepID=A0A9N7RTZ3_STRHE|nr:Unknown protein [Striga hermonthica]
MDAAFCDLNISTPQAFHGVARAVPGDPPPLDGARASKILRIQQLSLLGNGFPLGVIPFISPSPNHKELGSLALQSLIGKVCMGDWWVGLVGQFRPKKLLSSIKAEASTADPWQLPFLKNSAKHFLDKSLYKIGLCAQIALTSSSSLLFSTENHGEGKKRRTKAMLVHQLPDHDLTLEAAWPELFIDSKQNYWEVPESISLDCSSIVSDSGLRYRFGIYKNSGLPKAVDAPVDAQSPLALSPGLCAKAAFSIEKSKDLWRVIAKEEDDVIIKTKYHQIYRPSYDVRLKEPHLNISGIIGGYCESWLAGLKENRSRFGADVFGSANCSFQLGKFRNNFLDLTRIDARLDICSASALAKGLFSNPPQNDLSSPKLNFIFQQQVLGPIVFRVNSRFSLEHTSGRPEPKLEDVTYSLNYALRALRSGKVVAWYSPNRKEGMIELRLFEF